MAGYRATEKDIRDHLTAVGYYGRSARIHDLDLVAVGESGWVQVFRGRLEAKHTEDGWGELFVAVREDERNHFRVSLFDGPTERDVQVDEWSAGLRRRVADRGDRSVAEIVAVGFVAVVLAALAAVRFL